MDFAKQTQDTLQTFQVAQINAYYEGMKEGFRMFAWMKDGVTYVGTCGTLLKDAIDRLDDERANRLERLWRGPDHDSNLSNT